ncbi:hypothetical protein ACWGTO_34030, partial [Mesorhizobium sp. PL10]
INDLRGYVLFVFSSRCSSRVKVNPRQARRFAEATGRLAKTDRLDAAMLARKARLEHLDENTKRT